MEYSKEYRALILDVFKLLVSIDSKITRDESGSDHISSSAVSSESLAGSG